MAHFLQPIIVFAGDTPECCTRGRTGAGFLASGYRTSSTLQYDATLAAGEDDDDWDITPAPGSAGIISQGIVSFGVCCIWKLVLRITVSASSTEFLSPDVGTIVVSLNNTVIETVTSDQFELHTQDVLVDLNAHGVIDNPCGNSIHVDGTLESADPLDNDITSQITLQVVSVTPGPPP